MKRFAFSATLIALCGAMLCGCLLQQPPVGSGNGKPEDEEELEVKMLDATIEKAFGGAEATVVVVHDDGTHSTVDYMVDSFTQNGLVGTLGLITKNLANKGEDGKWMLKESEVEYWRGVLDSGTFDIASHSHTHTFWGISDEAESGWYLDSGNNLHEYRLEAGRITEEVAGSREILKTAFPDQRVLAFIKPGFGRVSDENGTRGMTQISKRAYEIIADNYIGMRNTGGDVDSMPTKDIYNVKSHTVKNTDTSDTWLTLVDLARAQNGLLVFLFHRIEEAPQNSLRADIAETDKFFAELGKLKSGGYVWNPYLADAMLYSSELEAATLDVRRRGDSILIDLTDSLDNSIYDHPLTVRIPISDDCSLVSTSRGEILPILSSNHGNYVLIDIVPDSGTVILSESR